MIIALIGQNTFALKQRMDELAAKFVRENNELALERIDLADQDIGALNDAISSLPFLSNRKMVVARGLSALKPSAEQIEQIISSTADTTDLIIYEPLTDKRSAFYKSLRAKSLLEEYNELDAPELVKWLVNYAKISGGEISISDASYLVSRVGVNQAMLSNELEKLITYESKILRKNIDLLVDPAPQSKIFDLLDAAFSTNKKQALKLYEDQRAQKVEPQAILAMMAWQLRLLSIAKYGRGKTSAEISKDSGLNSFPISKAQGLASKLSEKRLAEIVSDALAIDVRGKTTSLDMDEALKTYITTL